MAEKILPLKPMRRVLVSDEIIEQIKNLILDGTLKPGDRLASEIKLAQQMNVGRSTIREALKVLIHLGFIERKNKVAIVSDRLKGGLDPQSIVERFKKQRSLLEMIEVRKLIEPGIASLAATRCEPGDLQLLLKDVEAMDNTLKNIDAFLLHDYHFHLHIAQASKNQILIEIVLGIQHVLRRTQEHILQKSKNIHPRSLDYHWKIFKAIEDGHPELAKESMSEHILDIETEMYTILKQEKQNN